MPVADAFRHVDTWVFDLDNTLYPAHSNLFDQVNDRIREYVQKLLNLDAQAAQRVQKDYYHRYGTTLRGLMQEHDISPDGFLEYVHDIDHSHLDPDPRLGEAISALPGRRFILTNGSRRHAEKVAERLGITDHFEDIFDIVAADLLPKPAEATYARFLELHGLNPKASAMFEDLSRNLKVPGDLGMRTVLVVPEGTREVFRESWELEGRTAPHIDFVTDHLTGFLERLLDHNPVSPAPQER
ncbi:pyrimidine 5'-nucleotidase [Amorphus orientalis]|uniref:Hydrolase of the HAD superfamily n=1 Tax=Amorphus orientalis TaxID=649198 RepID=A0AAE3VR48_9HYPH|nr:pyrimidine 5'-nucleotidase [Amorphus orientalis]MDQ0316655.1 putative hydrolase of the HAD superfamily [Amorphus orientalis]